MGKAQVVGGIGDSDGRFLNLMLKSKQAEIFVQVGVSGQSLQKLLFQKGKEWCGSMAGLGWAS